MVFGSFRRLFRLNCKPFLKSSTALLMSGEPLAKKLHTMVKIGTHNGTFHCDEVVACFLLKQLDQYKDAEIVRSRDTSVLATCDIVVDVGAVYDPATHRYDHHQRTFSDSMTSLRPDKKWTTKLSSSGLVYVHFGMDIIAGLLGLPTSDPITSTVYDKVYENFMEEIDAIDNGISQHDEKPRYRVSTNLSSRVAGLNPQWNDTEMDENSQFHKAVAMAGGEFLDRVNFYKNSWLPARKIVETALNERHTVDPSGKILCFKNGGAPWKDHLFSLEEELHLAGEVLYVLYPDASNNWRVQCVPLTLGDFVNRLSLPEEWRGVRDQALSDKSGIADCIFVHMNGFIGGNKRYEGALEMARRSLQQAEKKDDV